MRPDGSTFVKAADYLPPNTSEKQQFAVDLQDMKRSQKIAAAIALKQAGVKGVKIIPAASSSPPSASGRRRQRP